MNGNDQRLNSKHQRISKRAGHLVPLLEYALIGAPPKTLWPRFVNRGLVLQADFNGIPGLIVNVAVKQNHQQLRLEDSNDLGVSADLNRKASANRKSFPNNDYLSRHRT